MGLWLTVEATLAADLATEALMMSPGLVERIRRSKSSEERESNLEKLLIVVNSETYLPYIVRSEEQHPIYGNATKDVYLSNYRDVQGIKFPHTIQTIYSSSSQRLNVVLEDFVIGKINATAKLGDNFFDLVPHGQKVNISEKHPDVPSGLVTDYSTSLLGSPVKNVSVEALKSARLVDLPQVYWLIIDDGHDLGFKQRIIEFETEVIVCDAPPLWSEAVMEWVEKNIGKKVTYMALLKHTLYVHRDNKVQAWFNWSDQAPHAADWTYVMVTEQCPDKNSSIFVYEADTWEAGLGDDLGNRQQCDADTWMDYFATTADLHHGFIHILILTLAVGIMLINYRAF
ncbi:hypothetical protein FVEG_10687 [Fusarium verticillioides 7600]|uniref:Uncharacterized protein n=1 Tax=Gibberella moniliformis (strain M3125 / FGSC 7600) TaxID=334819 RepID=W7ML26_GIBM7|nr:hypothetical protein FVEG_10687 [Fusarium verticillioides 7600]EWG51806.1 hypothetical protein FVEG_10687 [Fusarium verticillioides 7600]